MADIAKLQEELSQLTILEAAELVKNLEEAWGVSAAAAVAGPAAGPAAEAEEKTDFDVVLEEAGGSKIGVIKAVRGVVSGLGLADAKKLVESAPVAIAEGLPKEAAEEAKKVLEDAGAKVTLK